ncbi:enoyl-CoA hydratase/isomerase family protein [Alicyclobacillus dauci]|uniref:Enoyl-CoA hydratase/isomerase family protein n=1 Tax=Alicyclobacillus dauci TaxID=1475485 RepID=A0ABY6Z0B9_9BACL|nr:enoyl-CoA hydratase/isomerase family protein [Alicyclobacillus dauci]WAH36287.1 enoyl-CoA hydratase/isomerase family protein [Alicyclobacillus dauci]
MSDVVSYFVDGVCARIHIENPPVNALNLEAFAALDSYLCEAERDDEVCVILITAAGTKAFVAGIDIKQVLTFEDDEMGHFNGVSGRALRRIESCSKPVVCAVNGLAYGAGFELALACDFRLAAQNAVFALPELTLGIIPGGGGTQRLTRLIGEARSKEITMLGRSLSADEAKTVGLVCDVVGAEELQNKAQELVNHLAKRPAVALAQAKRVIHLALDVPLESGLTEENQAFMTAFSSVDGREGVRAFSERRKPVFVGK